MPEPAYVNLDTVATIAKALGTLNEEVIYVGGAVISLYVHDPSVAPPRPTQDVDLSVQVSTYSEMSNLSKRLAAKGIYPAPTEQILYRYQYRGILIDFIPYEATALGPTNSWLKMGFQHSIWTQVRGSFIRILPLSLFLATKWEAYQSRGSDPRTSHDFEDMVYLLDNAEDWPNGYWQAPTSVQHFLQKMAESILRHPYRNEILECHMDPSGVEIRRNMLIKQLESITDV